MIRYSNQNQRQQEKAYSYTPSAEVEHQPRNQQLPALKTRGELEMMEAGSITEVALQEVAKLTLIISQLAPSDPETYGLMLSLREEYTEVAKHQIRCLRRGG